MPEYAEKSQKQPEEPSSVPVRKARNWVKWSAIALFGGGLALNFAGDHFHRKDLYRKLHEQEQDTKERGEKLVEIDHRIQELEKQQKTFQERLDQDGKATLESINGAIGTLRELRDLFDGKE